MKLSVVDVKCVDQRGVRYVVEMQLFNVQGFEERVIYSVAGPRMPRDASKAFTMQLRTAEDYRHFKGVVGELCEALGIGWSDERQSTVEALSHEALQELWRSLLRDQRWP